METTGGRFVLSTDLAPAGDQPEAIRILTGGVRAGLRDQTLLGVTGSGKTFTMAHVIAELGRPALVLAPNKTLAAQLWSEFRALFPGNAVEYFVSYYDYYQPEAYIPQSDTFIEKDAMVNERIDRMRHAATQSVLTRRDVLVVASVSCIYGLGSPADYVDMSLTLRVGETRDRQDILRTLVLMQYSRNDAAPRRGTFRARGDVIEIVPVHADDRVIRIELFGDDVESIAEVDLLRGQVLAELRETKVFPSSHYVTPKEKLRRAIGAIEEELGERLGVLRGAGKLLEAQRLEMRTHRDLELLEQVGHCTGIENYSRHLDGRASGEPPATLIDYFPRDFLLFVDESHVTVPQIGGMYRGDRARKETLVQHGFRLPSALDNRPLRFEEWEARVNQVLYVSATPGDWELRRSEGVTAEQIIRPTGLIDPDVEIRPARGQIDDLLDAIREVVGRGHRVLVTALTKRMAEEIAEFYRQAGVRVRWLHSDIETLERTALLRSLRLGEFDVLVGINLLREGLDLPEVGLVAILDADKEGFLRSHRSLIQTIGRAARNVEGRVILYADRETESLRLAVEETRRRRTRQAEWNAARGITPRTIRKAIHDLPEEIFERDWVTVPVDVPAEAEPADAHALAAEISAARDRMLAAAAELRFEEAAELRDRIAALERRLAGAP